MAEFSVRVEIDEEKFQEMIEDFKKNNPNFVEVVRCKDCKNRPTVEDECRSGFDIDFPNYKCPCQCDDGYYNWMPKDDWFCADGERKDNVCM